jgi:hypothetical protein
MIRERIDASYRTRRCRDPWFDRLTTLSEVEGVSSKPSSDLDSGQSLRDFRNDEIRARDERIATCTPCSPKEYPEQYTDQMLFLTHFRS